MAESGSYDQATLLRRQKIADAMLADSRKAKPIRHWAEGLAQLADAGVANAFSNKVDQESKATRAADMASLAALLGGSPAASTSVRPAETSSELVPPAASPAPQTSFPGATEIQTGSNGQKIPIYGKSDDPVPSPLDPPSGQDRTRMIATILGEAANQPAVGQNAVASVIRNRAVAGNYGGRSPSEVVTARNQFEPWNTQGGRDKMAAMAADPSLAAKADRAIALAYGEGGLAPNDPTNGAKNFIEPRLQTALGRPMPDWAKAPGVMIGDHKFIGGATPPGQAPYEVAGPPTAPPQAPVAQAMTPPQMPAAQPAPSGGLLASATPQQRAAILAGMNASEGSPARAIATAMMQNLTKADGPTDEIKEYNLDATQRKAAGLPPRTFFEFKSDLKKAGATNVTTNVDKGEDSFAKAAGTAQAKRFDELAGEGQKAKQMIADIDTLIELGKSIGTGKGAEVLARIGPWAESIGIPVKGLSEIQAFEAIVNRVAPSMRVPGSGAQSDLELKNFLKSLPTLGNTPEGNAIGNSVLKGLQENKVRAAEIASKALNGEISRPQAEKMLRELPDPMEGYRAYQKANKGKEPASAPAPAAPAPDRAAIEAEMKRRGLLK